MNIRSDFAKGKKQFNNYKREWKALSIKEVVTRIQGDCFEAKDDHAFI